MAEDTPITMQDFLKGETDFDELLNSLSFREELVTRAAALQPTLFVRAARLRVQCMRERARADAQLDEIKSQAAIRAREFFEANGKKYTVDAVADRVKLDPEVQKAAQSVRIGDAREEMAKLLIEAYRHRRDSIKIIAEAQLIEGNGPMVSATEEREHAAARTEARKIQQHRRRALIEEIHPND